jgi:hypothetical protein
VSEVDLETNGRGCRFVATFEQRCSTGTDVL